MKDIENKKGWCHFSPAQIWEGPLYHNHKTTQGQSVTQEDFCHSLELVYAERLNESPKREGCVVSVGGGRKEKKESMQVGLVVYRCESDFSL